MRDTIVIDKALKKYLILAAATVLIRLIFMGWMDLLPEEAYYWSYSQHLAFGYLDHPPMVAWLNFLSQALIGKSEFAVRLPAFLTWLVMVFFMVRLARKLFDRSTADRMLPLLAILPIYFSVGFLMTPDAPLYAAWAGFLYFFHQAITTEKNTAWLGAGICLGLGLLSKYTMGLVVPAAGFYMILDRSARRWFFRPQPYLALIIGILLFLPVIYWNYTHDWMSFAFQGSRRWTGGLEFNLHIVIGSIFVLLTPVGVVEMVRALARGWKQSFTASENSQDRGRLYLFMIVFSLLPLTIFIIQSFRGQPKLNWTGPVWLSILPIIAWNMKAPDSVTLGWWARFSVKGWKPTLYALIVLYIAGFGYVVGGMPGWPTMEKMALPVAWKQFGARVEQLEEKVASETGSSPLIVGLDKYWLASELSFYDPDESDFMPEFAGTSVFRGNSLMWDYWVPIDQVEGRNLLLICFKEEKLHQPWITGSFSELSPIHREMISKFGRNVASFYWQVGYDYHE